MSWVSLYEKKKTHLDVAQKKIPIMIFNPIIDRILEYLTTQLRYKMGENSIYRLCVIENHDVVSGNFFHIDLKYKIFLLYNTGYGQVL